MRISLSRGWTFDTVHNGVRLGDITLQVPGKHNALNALAAFVTGLGLDFPATDLRAGLESFSGTRRRFDFKGEVGEVRVFDDYAHHPTEIEATLRAARDVVGEGRLVVAFQAHHYYRTAMFVKEFGAALGPGRRGRGARDLRPRRDARSPVRAARRWRPTYRWPRSTWSSSRPGPRWPVTSSSEPGRATSS